MTDSERLQQPYDDDEQLHYEEAPPSSLRDNLGILLSLLLLGVIGFAGYIWLTPGKEFADYLPSRSRSAEIPVSQNQGMAEMSADRPADVPDKAALEHCPVCNMFSMRSRTALHAAWSNGNEQSFDSWSCFAQYVQAQGLAIPESLEVRSYTDDSTVPVWLPADSAVYRYDTSTKVSGSMPPGIAAFADSHIADTRADLGGELLDYTALLSRLGIEAGMPAAEQPVPLSDAGSTENPADISAVPAQADESAVSAQAASGNLLALSGLTDNACSVCGMFADRSPTRVIVRWNDGTYTQHDCFDCAFSLLSEQQLMDEIQVTAWSTDNPGSVWLDARRASYLYETKTLPGSMPPYVAAFGSATEASAAQPELGGEQLSFSELAARWQQ